MLGPAILLRSIFRSHSMTVLEAQPRPQNEAIQPMISGTETWTWLPTLRSKPCDAPSLQHGYDSSRSPVDFSMVLGSARKGFPSILLCRFLIMTDNVSCNPQSHWAVQSVADAPTTIGLHSDKVHVPVRRNPSCR